MYIYFDLDNTLIDELGQAVRPGMFELLDSFKANNAIFGYISSLSRCR